MKKVFLDTNIVLDLLGEREPYYQAIAQIATLAEREKLVMVVSPITFTTVNYFLTKFESFSIAREKLRKFKILCEVATIDEQTIEKGLNSSFKDFEDAVQYFCATESDCEVNITRNAKDFKKSMLPLMTAEEFLKVVQAE